MLERIPRILILMPSVSGINVSFYERVIYGLQIHGTWQLSFLFLHNSSRYFINSYCFSS